jgi:hypothetical protein
MMTVLVFKPYFLKKSGPDFEPLNSCIQRNPAKREDDGAANQIITYCSGHIYFVKYKLSLFFIFIVILCFYSILIAKQEERYEKNFNGKFFDLLLYRYSFC